jgi:UDP-N-acetyl-D-galactosamine dehydrogenase
MIKEQKKIAIIGLGYIGLPLAVEFGKSRNVVGFDINQNRIDELNIAVDSTLEVTKAELERSKNLIFSCDEKELEGCKIFIVTVPTPIDEANRPNLSPLKNASNLVARALSKDSIVIFESTVFPGCTEEVCIPILEEVSGLEFNKDFFCGYSPERINPGDKVNTLTKIKKIISGSNPKTAQEVKNLYSEIIEAGTFQASSIKVAEAAKVIENTQRDLNIALVNELSVIFNRLNIDTLEVLEAAESKWNFLPFKPGMVGGHCIGVDPYYLTHKAEEVGYNPQVILAGRRINDEMAIYSAKQFIQLFLRNEINPIGATIGIMGITFKENCPDIRNSKVFDLIDELKRWNLNIKVEDGWADKEEVFYLHGITLEPIEKDSLDSVIVAVGHNEYRKKNLEEIRRFCRSDKPILADLKGIYDKKEAEELGFTVFRL